MGASVRSVFPLVPRHRVSGLPFGGSRSLRRGHGSDVAGTRPYAPGDPLGTIDWRASARLSTARATDEFLVRERYAEESPRVVVLVDARPSLALYPPPFPWLSKPDAVRSAVELIVQSAEARGASVGYLDYATGHAHWLEPSRRGVRGLVARRLAQLPSWDGPADGIERGLGFLGRFRSELASGTFVFVVSDFLGAPVPDSSWLTAAARRWDVVPVLVQDATWEQSFPLVGGIVVPFVEPGGTRAVDVRLSRRDARALRDANVRRRDALLSNLVSLGLDPVVLASSDDGVVDAVFGEWAARRDLRRLR
jgi:uncharacterized protein (DUF58 family)